MLRHTRWKGFQEPTIEEIAKNPLEYYLTQDRQRQLEEYLKKSILDKQVNDDPATTA